MAGVGDCPVSNVALLGQLGGFDGLKVIVVCYIAATCNVSLLLDLLSSDLHCPPVTC